MSIGWQPQRPRLAAWPAQPRQTGSASPANWATVLLLLLEPVNIHLLVVIVWSENFANLLPLPPSLTTPQGRGVCRAWGRILDQTQALAVSQIRKSSKSSEVAKLLIFWPCTLDYGISRKSHNIIRKCLEIYLKSVFCSEYLFVLQIKFNFINQAIWFMPYFMYFLCH